MRLKADTYVVESNVHFPTDYNLLWDSGRKCLDCIRQILSECTTIKGWRKINNWRKKLKNGMRQLGKVSKSGGKNKQSRLEQAASSYIQVSTKLLEKLKKVQKEFPITTEKELALIIDLEHYIELLEKHIDLVDRRLLQKQIIPNEEKLYSIFETYTDLIIKGKSRPNIELGKKLSIVTDQYGLIVHHQVWDNVSDSTMSLSIGGDLIDKYSILSISFDKGFWNKENKSILELYIPRVVMPKRGKLNQEEKEEETHRHYKKLRNAHQAVESNINELENRGLDRCPDRGYKNFKRYVSLGVCAYNIHKIGAWLLGQRLKLLKKQSVKKVA